jgi:hypothetical protein
MMRKGIGPRPIEKAATKAKLEMTQIRRQEYTIPRPRKRLATPMLEILHSNNGFRPLRSMRVVDGRVVQRLTRDMMREIKAEEEGRMEDRIEVE